MKARALLVFVSVIGLLGLTTAAPASAKPTTGSFTVTIPVSQTITVDGTSLNVTGTLTADVTRFSVQNGHVVAVATLSGTLTVTSDLGSATIDVTGTRVVLNANIQADCQGNLHIDFNAVLQLRATVAILGITLNINETIPLSGSVNFTATTQQQTSLICDLSHVLQNGASLSAVVDKLNSLLKRL